MVARVTLIAIGEPLRMMASVAIFFGPSAAMRRARSCGSVTVSPSIAVITSPLLTPAVSAGEFLVVCATSAPEALFKPRSSAMSEVTGWISTPIQPRVTAPFSLSCCTTFLTTSLVMAKPMPTLPPEGEKIAVFTPTTSPWALKVGPPELPWLTGASICRKSSYGPEPMSRPRAETIPAVTVPPSPKGLPTAMTQSPTRGGCAAKVTKGKSDPCAFKSARSVLLSAPITLAGMVLPSAVVMVTSVAWSTT